MNACPKCGGFLYRRGNVFYKSGEIGLRYTCRECKKSITVKNGVLQSLGRPPIKDWRFIDADQGNRTENMQ